MEKTILIPLIEENLSQREIAARLDVSQSTVKYFLKKYELSTKNNPHNFKNRTDEFKRASSVKAVQKRREKIVVMAIEYKGGKCIACGYNKCSRALDFHHIDPSTKEFGIAQKGYTRSWSRVKDELDKCMLLCSNCHREVHAGDLTI